MRYYTVLLMLLIFQIDKHILHILKLFLNYSFIIKKLSLTLLDITFATEVKFKKLNRKKRV